MALTHCGSVVRLAGARFGGIDLRALITGISGFVGSHLAEFLLNHTDWQVAGTVYGRLDKIEHLRDRLLIFPAELSRIPGSHWKITYVPS
jgi:hypothetical protein